MPDREPHEPASGSAQPSAAREAQLERAQGAWELRIHESGDDPRRFLVLRRLLRMKSFEADALRARLPGAVRRGARVDLQPLLDRLTQAGIAATLERRAPRA
jgi:hypothetical protein